MEKKNVLIGATGLAIVVGLGSAALRSGSETTSTVSSTDAPTTVESNAAAVQNTEVTTSVVANNELNLEDIAYLREHLTVSDTDFDCNVEGAATGMVNVGTLKDGRKIVLPRDTMSLGVNISKKDKDHRSWSDAFTSENTVDTNNVDGLKNSVFAQMCANRLELVSVANFLSNLEVGSGKDAIKLVAINPWLAPYAGSPESINDLAGKYPASIDEIRSDADLAKYNEQITTAEKIAALMERFQAVYKDHSAQQYSYAIDAKTSLTLGGLPEVKRVDESYENNNQFLAFEATLKSGKCVRNAAIGINVHDGRPALLTDSAVCEKPAVVTTLAPKPTTPAPTTMPNRQQRRHTTTVPKIVPTTVHKARTTTVPTTTKVTVEKITTTAPVTSRPVVTSRPLETTLPTGTTRPTETTRLIPTTIKLVEKKDDGKIPGNSLVPADGDKGSPDVAGKGPAGQTPNDKGYLPNESIPTSQAPRAVAETATTVAKTTVSAPAITSPQPVATNPPVRVIEPATTNPPGSIPAQP